MIFKRVLHPVGQGAFFTEQFFDDSLDTLLYNVVYDCGSKSSGIQKQMERSIRNILHDKKKIDVLFLSHFDDDHVNYVMYLKLHGHLGGTRIFIPMLEAEEWLEIEPFYNNYQLILSLNEQRVGGTKVIKAQLSQNGLDYNQLTISDYVLQHMGELKKIYQGLGKKPTGGTAINLNTLQVMSFPVDPDLCKVYGNRTTCSMYFYEWFRWNERITKYFLTMNNLYAGSCLYTGDTSANDPVVWSKIEGMTREYGSQFEEYWKLA